MSAPKRPPRVRNKHRRAGTVSVRRRDGIGDETDAYLLGREIEEGQKKIVPLSFRPNGDPVEDPRPDEVTLAAFIRGQWDSMS